jgi:hypothetical protein
VTELCPNPKIRCFKNSPKYWESHPHSVHNASVFTSHGCTLILPLSLVKICLQSVFSCSLAWKAALFAATQSSALAQILFCWVQLQIVRRHIYGWGTATSWKVTVSIPDEVIGFFNLPNPSSLTVVLESTQSLTEMSTRNLWEGKEWPACKADSLTSVSWLSWKCRSLKISQTFWTKLWANLFLNYARSSGMHPYIKCNRTIFTVIW